MSGPCCTCTAIEDCIYGRNYIHMSTQRQIYIIEYICGTYSIHAYKSVLYVVYTQISSLYRRGAVLSCVCAMDMQVASITLNNQGLMVVHTGASQNCGSQPFPLKSIHNPG